MYFLSMHGQAVTQYQLLMETKFFNQVTKNEELEDVSITIMNDAWVVQEEVGKASQINFNIMYSGKQSDTFLTFIELHSSKLIY